MANLLTTAFNLVFSAPPDRMQGVIALAAIGLAAFAIYVVYIATKRDR